MTTRYNKVSTELTQFYALMQLNEMMQRNFDKFTKEYILIN